MLSKKFALAAGVAITAGTLAGAAAVPAFAHHAASVMFSPDQEVVLTGTVKEFRYSNPHSSIQLVVPRVGREVEWRIVTESPRELATRHVDRDHLGGVRLEEAVGETAGGRAGVESAPPVHVDLETHQRRRELLAATRHESGCVGDDVDRLARRDQAVRARHGAAGDEHPPGFDGERGVGEIVEQSSSHQLGVESPPYRHRRRIRGAN